MQIIKILNCYFVRGRHKLIASAIIRITGRVHAHNAHCTLSLWRNPLQKLALELWCTRNVFIYFIQLNHLVHMIFDTKCTNFVINENELSPLALLCQCNSHGIFHGRKRKLGWLLVQELGRHNVSVCSPVRCMHVAHQPYALAAHSHEHITTWEWELKFLKSFCRFMLESHHSLYVTHPISNWV